MNDVTLEPAVIEQPAALTLAELRHQANQLADLDAQAKAQGSSLAAVLAKVAHTAFGLELKVRL